MSDFFINRYAEFGEKVEPFALPTVIRTNTLKISPEALFSRLKKKGVMLKKIDFLPGSFEVESNFSISSTSEHLLGLFYIQEKASQIPPWILKPSPGELVLDMCAAPGSKFTQMAAMMENKGVLAGLDNEHFRIESLLNNVERMSVKNSIIFHKDARYASDLQIRFDKVLLDAPCSGNCIADPNWFEKRKESQMMEGIKERAKEQRLLLSEALKCVKKSGTLVYSTCSLEPEENELNMQWLLERYDDIFLEKIEFPIGEKAMMEIQEKKLDSQISNCLRFWPNKTGTQGFFMAKIRFKR